MNFDERGNPRTDLRGKGKKIYRSWGRSGRSPRCSGVLRLMQRPRLMQRSMVAAELRSWATRGRWSRRGRRERERKWPFGPIYKERDMSGARIKEPRVSKQSCGLNCRRLVNRIRFFITNDVTPVYRKQRRWHHGGSTKYKKMLKMKIFAKDWHEPVQINLGPNVGDITTRRKPARTSRVNFISSWVW